MKHNFDNVKVGDVLLVELAGYSSKDYCPGKVIGITSKRFTVAFGGDREMVFTKNDGREYPRSTGYHRTYVNLSPMTDEGRLLIQKHRLARKANRLAGRLSDIFGNANYRNAMSSMDVDYKELEESIKMLEAVYERFKKYGPKEDET